MASLSAVQPSQHQLAARGEATTTARAVGETAALNAGLVKSTWQESSRHGEADSPTMATPTSAREGRSRSAARIQGSHS